MSKEHQMHEVTELRNEVEPRVGYGYLNEDALTFSALLRRAHWSPRAVSHFLGHPDALRVGHRHADASKPMRLYAVRRIEGVESTPEWASWASGDYHAQRRQQRTVQGSNRSDRIRLASITVRHTDLPVAHLIELSLNTYNEWKRTQRARLGLNHIPVTVAILPAEQLGRLLVNYLRHNLTNYETLIKELALREAPMEEYVALRHRVYSALAKSRPDLADVISGQERKRSAGEALVAA